jgi:hypothetical protein
MLTSLKASVLGAFIFASLIFQFNTAHAYLVKVGNKNTCVFQCLEKAMCPKNFSAHSDTACRGESAKCSELATATCGKKKLKLVHQGPMNVELEIAEVADSTGNKFSGVEAEKELNALGVPAERK